MVMERLAKRLARTGLCSRRMAERWIVQGRVRVDGTLIVTPACCVTSESCITVDDRDIPEIEGVRLWRYHKPRGFLTTTRDTFGRRTVFDGVPRLLPHLISVGRLDMNTEGLLLFTNTGGLARHLTLPRNGYTRYYRVRVYGEVDIQELQDVLAEGITIGGVRYGGIRVGFEVGCGRRNRWMTLQLCEGKNREVRRILGFFGLQVSRLIRTAFGPFTLENLALNAFEEVSQQQLDKLKYFESSREEK